MKLTVKILTVKIRLDEIDSKDKIGCYQKNIHVMCLVKITLKKQVVPRVFTIFFISKYTLAKQTRTASTFEIKYSETSE